MKTVYLELKMGAAGDMLCAALVELLDDEQRAYFFDKMNTLGLPNVKISCSAQNKNGISGTGYVVEIGGIEEGSGASDYSESSLSGISKIIKSLELPQTVIKNACEVYAQIAQAESRVHGEPVDMIHFHEVGALDAVADIVGFCVLADILKLDNFIASPINVGGGLVHCAHGTLPVPAPATAELLCELPCYTNGIEGELCTPTGAALIGHFVSEFSKIPSGSFKKVGYGMGKKNFASVNCVRAFLYENGGETNDDAVVELRCNVDDMTSEAVGFLTETLLANGARDVYVQSVFMKKNRPGFVIVCLCDKSDECKFTRLIFSHSATIGIRAFDCQRHVLERDIRSVETSLGSVRVKRSHGFGVERSKIEYEDISRIARERDMTLEQVEKLLKPELDRFE
ncbi:MAG: nickel pincer cofactor biosynthesis protein LarC [Oscillospiraceae bacterium]